MRIAESERRAPGTPARAADGHPHREGVARRVSEATRTAREAAALLMGRVPGTMQATRASARDATSALQTLPDSTLRWLAAGSVGLCTGLYLAGAPRVVTAAAVAPALLMGTAMVLRPTGPRTVPATPQADGASRPSPVRARRGESHDGPS